MKHPGPLLADHVDGTLDADMRARVEAHLERCAACREEVRLARVGKRAAGGLGAPAMPDGLGDRAVEEAARMAGEGHPEVTPLPGRDRRRPNAPRLAGVVAAAAAVIAIALVAPKLTNDPGSVAEQAAGSVPAEAAAPTVAANKVEASDRDYSSDDLTNEARAAQQALRSDATTAEGMPAGYALDSGATFFGGTTSSSTPLDEATRCLQRAFRSAEGKLVRVVLARFNGQPAYFGIYLVKPGADVPSGELRIDVASVDGCQILVQSSAKL